MPMKLPSYASDVTSLSSLRKEMCAICLEEYASRQVCTWQQLSIRFSSFLDRWFGVRSQYQRVTCVGAADTAVWTRVSQDLC